MKYLVTFLFLINCDPVFAGGLIDLDTNYIQQKNNRFQFLKGKVDNLSQQTRIGIFNHLKGYVSQQQVQQAPPSLPSPPRSSPPSHTLIHPDMLFRDSQIAPPSRYEYQDRGRHVTKDDMDRLVDSLSFQFKQALEFHDADIEFLMAISDSLQRQSQMHHDRWEITTLMNFITGGGLATLVTALATFGGLFWRSRRKNGTVANS